jgi:hypothetical protein
MGIEYDFYPDFICRKPKLKWNLTKFDFLRTQENNLDWCILTVRNTPTSGPWNSGTLLSLTTIQRSSILKSTPSLSPHPIPWEEMPNTRNNLISYWNRLMTSLLAPSTGILWKVPKQNPDQAVHFPPSSSPHHLCPHSQFASAELTFVGVTTALTHLPLPLTLSCGNLLRSCSPKEEYITCITAQQLYRIWLLDLEHRHETTARKDLPFNVADESFFRGTNQTILETDLTQ